MQHHTAGEIDEGYLLRRLEELLLMLEQRERVVQSLDGGRTTRRLRKSSSRWQEGRVQDSCPE